MPATAEPVRGFSLADFDGPNQPADNQPLYQQTGKPAETTPEPAPAAPPAEPDKDKTEPEPKDAGTEDQDEGPVSLSEAMDDEAKTRGDEEKAAAEEAKKTAEAEAEKPKVEAEKPAPDRDADLNPEIGPHVRPSTRKIITEMQAKAKAARDKEEAAIARAEAAEAKAREAEEKGKSVEPPKEMVEKIKMLEERVRELDISKDPALEAKYDRKISANQTVIVDLLKAQGFGMVADKDGKFVENPKAIADLVKSGLTMKALYPLTKKLREADLVDEADAIEEAVRENNRLARDKQAEIESWKGDYTKRQQAKEAETKQHQERRQAEFRTQTDSQLNAQLDELAKNFSYIKRPAAPLPTDSPSTVQAKNKAIAEYDAAAKQIETAVKGLNPADAPPEKFAEVVGRINASAIQAIVLKTHVLPRVIKDMAAKDARIKELEAKLGKIENAGRLSRTQSATTDERSSDNGRPAPQSLEDAFGSGPG